MSKYTVQHFGMFGGEMQNVVIVLSEKMIDVFVDRFGKDIRFSKTGDQKYPYRTTVEVCMSDKFLAWIIALGDEVKIIETDSEIMFNYIRGQIARWKYSGFSRNSLRHKISSFVIRFIW